MSTEITKQSFIEKYAQKKPTGGRKNWDEINKERKEAIIKFKEGKNTLLFLIPNGSTEPFTTWGYHKGLQEKDYFTVPCDHMNKDTDCVVCNAIAELKKENSEGNRHLWYPIEQKTEYWAPVIDCESDATMAKGPKWIRISKTIMNAFIEHFKNLEEDEYPFFDKEHPQRVIVNYDKNQPPALQYNVSFKPMKDVPSEETYAAWTESIKPVGEYIFSRKQEALNEMVENYFTRVAEALEAEAENNSTDKPAEQQVTEAVASAEGRLASLKKKS